MIFKKGRRRRHTQSCVQHVQRHLVALLRTRDRDQTLIAVFLRLIDLDHTATEVSDLVDLGTTLTDDGADHIVGNVDLLGNGLARNNTGKRLSSRAAVRLGMRSSVRSRLMRASTGIWSTSCTTAIVQRRLCNWSLSSRTAMGIWCAVGAGAGSVVLWVVTSGRIGMTVLSASRLRDIRNDLHTAGYDTSRTAATSGVGRCSRSTEPLGQLLYKSHSNIVSRNVHGISDTQHNKRAFSG